MIKRDFYLNQLISKRHSSKIKIITGLRNIRINFRELNQGFLIENTVYNELMTSGYKVDVGF